MILHTMVGSWPFNMEFGFDLPSIVEGKYNQTLITGKMKTTLEQLESIEEVKDILIINVNRVSRQITIYIEVVLRNGETLTTTGAVAL